jgi:uncharacterized membrane protein YphA (DoxX/SURF4 family)
MGFKDTTFTWYIVILRLYAGYYLLYQGFRKYQRDFPYSDWITRQIGDLSRADLYPWYKTFLTDYVVPHREFFGFLVMSGEILVGVCLILGLMTRFSSFVGLFMLINFYLGPGMARGGAAQGHQQTFIIILAVLLLSNPGKCFGLDGLIFRK